MERCSPAEMRDCLITVNEFEKIGIEFVAVPVLSPEHRDKLIQESLSSLDKVISKIESEDPSQKKCVHAWLNADNQAVIGAVICSKCLIVKGQVKSMSLYQCEECGAKESTALGFYWCQSTKLCSECKTGTWHGRFEKILLPKGMFITNNEGNLEHKENGDNDVLKYRIG